MVQCFAGIACATATSYTPAVGLAHAYMSSASYCATKQVTDWNCQACQASGTSLKGVTFLQNNVTENYGYVGQDAKTGDVYIAYRGSQNIENWINNLDFILTPYPGCNGCNVHQGFYNCYLSLSAQLNTALKGLNANGAPAVHTTGHSLGAAMTELTAFDLALAGYPLSLLVNFGQPRTGDPTYASSYTSMVIRGQDTTPLTFNQDALEAHRVNGSIIALSPLLVTAVERALSHPINNQLPGTEELKEEIVTILGRHSQLAVAKAAQMPLDASILASIRSGVYGTLLKLSDEHIKILSQMKFPGITNNILRGNKKYGAFAGAASFRVTHNADPVPHLPPGTHTHTHVHTQVIIHCTYIYIRLQSRLVSATVSRRSGTMSPARVTRLAV
jgi:hypothetical protein